MAATPTTRWLPSSKRHPCPICSRTKDGDCRISAEGDQVLCHHPKDYRPGEVIDGWAFTGNSSDDRAGHFTLHKPIEVPSRPLRKVVPLRPRAPKPAPITGPITLATITPVPPKGSPWAYSPTQRIERVNKADGSKLFVPRHHDGSSWAKGAGTEPWPVFGTAAAGWVLETEGEKCAEIALSAGVSAISQPGHAHKVEQVAERYRNLQAGGVEGIVYLADNDTEGQRRADQAVEAAAQVQLPLMVLPAIEVWPDLPAHGSIDDAPGTAAERVSAITAAITERSQTLLREQPKAEKKGSGRQWLAPDEVLALLPEHLGGMPRLNVRTRSCHVGDRVITATQASRLYLTLSNGVHTWPKEGTADALQELAEQAAFDPVMDYLTAVSASSEMLPMTDWQQLDQLLFNVRDPFAAAFLQRYLVGAVARAMDPGCPMRQLPVLIGPQGVGKSRTARELFGARFFTDQLTNKLDVDDVTRLQRHWCCELGELDGITRRTGQEALKAFISRQVDVERRKYGRGEEELPRRSVFWGTSNGAPLRDPTGSSRFVCIAIPEAELPVDRVKQHRDAIWARAVQQYRAQVPWHMPLAELRELAERNADFEQRDPWMDVVKAYTELRQATGNLPVQATEVLERLEISLSAQNNANVSRVRALMEQLGWAYKRKRLPDGKQSRGFWPPEG